MRKLAAVGMFLLVAGLLDVPGRPKLDNSTLVHARHLLRLLYAACNNDDPAMIVTG